MKNLFQTFVLIRVVLSFAMTLTAFSDELKSTSPGIKVAVAIEPYRFLVEQLGGEAVGVVTLLPDGVDPHFYSFTARQLRELSKVDFLLYSGLPFESQNLEKLKTVTGAKLISLAEIEEGSHAESGDHHHQHSHACQHHNHGSEDPHRWLSPREVMQQLEIIANALIDFNPEMANTIRGNLSDLKRRLIELDLHLRDAIRNSGFQGKKILVYHPAWGWFCKAYGLEQVSVEREGKPMSARELALLMRSVSEDQESSFIPDIWIQPQMDSRLAKRLATEVGQDIFRTDPLAYDYFAEMEKIAAHILNCKQ